MELQLTHRPLLDFRLLARCSFCFCLDHLFRAFIGRHYHPHVISQELGGICAVCSSPRPLVFCCTGLCRFNPSSTLAIIRENHLNLLFRPIAGFSILDSHTATVHEVARDNPVFLSK